MLLVRDNPVYLAKRLRHENADYRGLPTKAG